MADVTTNRGGTLTWLLIGGIVLAVIVLYFVFAGGTPTDTGGAPAVGTETQITPQADPNPIPAPIDGAPTDPTE
ncbi:hypothetical protein [Actibacterium ureilyticum]|uniref:hypothetical protein n=1 Tax=Actibacterium ureilyticum TaxID=1590614 RepID=UPI000BAAA748|nr:hypothetical protein [Actibacterium ureilyticum]